MSLDGDFVWVIKNLPLPPIWDPESLHMAAYFDLSDLGFVPGIEMPDVQYIISQTDYILETMPNEPVSDGTIESEVRQSYDLSFEGTPVPVHIPPPMSVNTYSYATIISPIRRGVDRVQEDTNHCTAGAYARSLDWLNDTYNLGLDMSGQDFYDSLTERGVSDQSIEGRLRTEWLRRKDQFARSISDGAIYTKAWDGGNSVDPIPGIHESRGDLLEWLLRESKTEDVEMAYHWTDSAGNGHGHIVTIVGVIRNSDGSYTVLYKDDEYQGYDSHGDTRIKYARLIPLGGGQYGFNNSNRRIHFAASESIKKTTSGGIPQDYRRTCNRTIHQGRVSIHELPPNDVHLKIYPAGSHFIHAWEVELGSFGEVTSEYNFSYLTVSGNFGYAPFCSRIPFKIKTWFSEPDHRSYTRDIIWTRDNQEVNKTVDSIKACPDFGYFPYRPLEISSDSCLYRFKYLNVDTDPFEIVKFGFYPSDTLLDSIEFMEEDFDFPITADNVLLQPDDEFYCTFKSVTKPYLYSYFEIVWDNDTVLTQWTEEPIVVLSFLCGDVNGDLTVNILDITYLIAYLYKNGPEPDPIEVANVNSDSSINILDITYLIAYLYKGGPIPDCGLF